ncbi:hypothetical protein CDD83_5644 [Cordyceps sp. RAO-2017]|nr:hypothetical protein CDD83_5644 [Cordyceps sp. RAO-2017]
MPNLVSHRSEVVQLTVQHARHLGVPIHLDRPVDGFSEDDGSPVRGWAYVTVRDEDPESSLCSAFRSRFPLYRLAASPLTSEFATCAIDRFRVWIGKSTHAILVVNNAVRSACCFCTRKVQDSFPEQAERRDCIMVSRA